MIVMSDPKMQELITLECERIANFLLEKNKAYGNSAAEPIRIFSKADPLAQIDIRIDDKLSRIAKGAEFPGDDTELDLIGYLILKRVLKRKKWEEKEAEFKALATPSPGGVK
jgi:hypothetical protein